jgi:Tfp pilus assembly protein PilF
MLFVVFQVFFGLAVFAITREYYQQDEETVSAHPWMAEGSATTWSQGITGADNDAEIYNNLGLTLYYLGRNDEALRWLNDGIAVDAEHQRIWLTLGFVNGQLGNFQQARVALTNATQIGNNESVRQSAMRMLDELP